MTLVPTANVVILFGRESARRLFTKGATFDNLIQGISADGSLGMLFNTQSNPNFISFEHNVAVGKNFEMSLSLIDPTQEFEKQFLTTNVLEDIAFTFDGGHNVPSDDQGAIAQKRLGPTITGLQSSFKTNKNEFDLIRRNRRELYIAYGIGNNLDLWAGPFKVVIANIDIKIEGSRVLTLKLVPIDNTLDSKARYGAYGESIDINSQGLTIACDGYSHELNINNPDPFVYSPYLPKVQFQEIDYHLLIVDTIRNYIQNATQNPNVIVLLPDLNKICKKHIDNLANKTRYSSSPVFALGPLYGGKQLSKSQANYGLNYDRQQKIELFLNELLGSFGLTLSTIIKQTNNSIIPTAINNPDLFKIGSFITAGAASQIIDYNTQLKNYYEGRTFKAKLLTSSDKGIPDHLKHLGLIIDRINQYSKAEQQNHYDIKFDSLVENNLRILDLWSTDTELNCSKFPLFGGKDGLLKDKEVVVFGDMTLIHFLLYGNREDKSDLSKFLHPLDAGILLQPKYKEKILGQVSYKDYVFGDITKAPDEFAFVDSSALLTSKEQELLKTKTIPVFTYNTQNPNIYELNLKDSGQYFSFLRSHFETVLYRKAAGVLGGSIPSKIGNFPISTSKDMIGYAVNAGYFNEGISPAKKGTIVDEIIKKLETDPRGTPLDKGEMIVEITRVLEELGKDVNLGLKILFKQWLACDPAMVVGDFLNQIYNKAYQLNIATVPIFKISNLLDLAKPCLVFMQHTTMPMTVQPKESLLGVIYSGAYRIMGYKHTITFNNCYSEFMLTKILSGGKKKQEAPIELPKNLSRKPFEIQDTTPPIRPSSETQGPPEPPVATSNLKSERQKAIDSAKATIDGLERQLDSYRYQNLYQDLTRQKQLELNRKIQTREENIQKQRQIIEKLQNMSDIEYIQEQNRNFIGPQPDPSLPRVGG